ncbi:MAG: hypothetical protein AAF366_21155, partial [Pseudomonadota bacterium]
VSGGRERRSWEFGDRGPMESRVMETVMFRLAAGADLAAFERAAVTPERVLDRLADLDRDVVVTTAWGETTSFLSPEGCDGRGARISPR